MSVVSLSFLGFFLITLVLYYVVPGKVQWCVLLLASLVFYFCSAKPLTFLYVLASMLTIYTGARIVEKEDVKYRKIIYVGTLLINVGMLAALKYMNFFVGNAGAIFKLFFPTVTVEIPALLAALGVSFYSLSMIGYLTDVYWGMYAAETNFLKLALFNCYFPPMISGPFCRYGELSKTLYGNVKISYDRILKGFQRILIGFFKKLVISEHVIALVDTIYGDSVQYGGAYIFLATALYTLQIYADFSGCMDIIFGVSECFGVILPENFNTPFVSVSIQEFWQRWHITLGTWLKDYIMYPILRSSGFHKMTKTIKKKWGKNAAKKIPTYMAMFVLWLAMGLWHGGGWNYIGEGIWFWAVVVLGQTMEPVFVKWRAFCKVDRFPKVYMWFQRIRTIVIYGVGALFFKAGTLRNALHILYNGMDPKRWISSVQSFGTNIAMLSESVGTSFCVWSAMAVCVGFVCMIFMGHIQYTKGSFREWMGQRHMVIQFLFWYVLLMCILIFGSYGLGYSASSFIYGGF